MMQTADLQIAIKGTRKGLSVTFGEGEWQALLHELNARLAQADAFFQDSRVSLHIGQREITPADLQALMDLLKNHKIELASVETSSTASAESAQTLQVRIALPEANGARTGWHSPTEPEVSEGAVLRHTLRSGQSLRHQGPVVIIGDVNPGAEVIAGGDILVWGKLRGMVHAGAVGDNEAIVCALELSPTQLRIGSHISISPDEKRSKRIQPEYASVVNGQIIVQPWSSK